mmetsp:Transcript_48650/g.59846  ORF Transcript_48650/g.59846 Transcript_48650/m.59846 type:complete len:207 (+) Transcript_48650:71-691(+)
MRDVPASASSAAGAASAAGSSTSSMDRPILIMRWMRAAYATGSSREKPEVSSAVSNSRKVRSRTVLFVASASAFSFSALMMACLALISRVFLEIMYADDDASRSACAFMMRSMFAVHPYSPVTRMQGDFVRRSDSTTFSTLSPSVSLTVLHSASYAAFSSSNAFFSSSVSSNLAPSLDRHTNFLSSKSFSCCMQYSSMGSVMNSTS